MGICGSSMGDDSMATPEEVKRSKAVERIIKEDEKRMQKEVKILLLGPGESGKTTILKQMKIIYLNGFTSAEFDHYRTMVFHNILDSMILCLDLMYEWSIPLEIQENEKYYDLLTNRPDLMDGQAFPRDYLGPLLSLWNDGGVQKCVARGNEGAVPENMNYFFPKLHEIFNAKSYRPSEQDVLRCRGKTTGITEMAFHISELTYRMFDVGGQRSERRKWIHCFDGVTAILFVVAISGYDQCLIEDKDSNQMQESLMLFDSICNSQWFLSTSMILFLNKSDLFKEKVESGHNPLKTYFPDYEGPPMDYIAAREYFRKRFIRLNRQNNKEIYTNFTTAVDTTLLKVVMSSVTDIIITKNLQEIIL
ncbi:guanine nucleotide binding protein, alpha [Atractiella rhizophila]|nr:guanine nucleotide binding protein, alpha [Atractiella rhizophila]